MNLQIFSNKNITLDIFSCQQEGFEGGWRTGFAWSL
jgi:hypothetical protein